MRPVSVCERRISRMALMDWSLFSRLVRIEPKKPSHSPRTHPPALWAARRLMLGKTNCVCGAYREFQNILLPMASGAPSKRPCAVGRLAAYLADLSARIASIFPGVRRARACAVSSDLSQPSVATKCAAPDAPVENCNPAALREGSLSIEFTRTPAPFIVQPNSLRLGNVPLPVVLRSIMTTNCAAGPKRCSKCWTPMMDGFSSTELATEKTAGTPQETPAKGM